MKAIKPSVLRENLKEVFDQAANGETFIVSRPKGHNVVVLSEAEFNELSKARRNAEYLAQIDAAMQALEEGKGVRKSLEDLEALTDG